MKIIIDALAQISLFISAFFIFFQAIKIQKERKVAPFSFISYIGFSLFQVSVVLHGILLKDITLIVGMGACFIANLIVVCQIFIYKKASN